MASREHRLALLQLVNGLGFGDRDLWLKRQALVADLGLDEGTIAAACAFLHIDLARFSGRWFNLASEADGGEPAVIIGALDAEERLVDAIAWPVDRPAEVATFGGISSLLAAGALSMPSLDPGAPVLVHRTPLRWLQHGFEGVVVLDAERAAPHLVHPRLPLFALEDAALAEALLAAANAIGSAPPRLLTPLAAE